MALMYNINKCNTLVINKLSVDQANLTSLKQIAWYLYWEVDGGYEEWEPPHIFLSSTSYDKIYPISVKIRKY